MQFFVVPTKGSTYTWYAASSEGRIFLRSTQEFPTPADARTTIDRIIQALPESDLIEARELYTGNTARIELFSVRDNPPFSGITCMLLQAEQGPLMHPFYTWRWGFVDEGGTPMGVHTEYFTTREYAIASCERGKASSTGATVITPSEVTQIS